MKKPKKPYKPTEPQQVIRVKEDNVNIQLYDGISLYEILKELQSLDIDFMNDNVSDQIYVDVSSEWYNERYICRLKGLVKTTEVINKKYESEFKRWVKKMESYEEKLIQYEMEMRLYNEWEKEEKQKKKEKLIEEAKQLLKKEGIL